ncbi:glycosyltransferase family A protein [Salinibacter ruber]|uniref:glycosyltransferase family A protein n=1 Tax=Salinibacter ruber TaxID=146919 RepID=UPI00216890B8|nr:glycosyltransferase family A protein [Salinibacter ruber]MCS4054628.1 glycosyltransferase involved in cell wall biosynthesis [Salinibacter ruber]
MPTDEHLRQVQGLWPETTLDGWMSDECQEGLVSLVIPTYNRANLLSETLTSVARQTYRPIEVLIVDDGSTDRTPQVVERWREGTDNDLNVQYLCQENQGANVARNRGLLHSSGQYIQFVDSDDVLHPQQVACLRAAIQKPPEGDLVFSEQAKGETAPSWFPDREGDTECSISGPKQVEENPMVVPKNRGSVLYHRSLCRKAGPWDESLIRWQDMEYMFRISALRPSYRRIAEKMYFLREHAEGRIQDLYQQRRGIKGGLNALSRVERVVETADQRHEQACYCMARYYLGIAKLAMVKGDSAQVWKAFAGAQRQVPNTRFSIQLRLARVAYCGLGGKVTKLLLDGYTFLRERMAR